MKKKIWIGAGIAALIVLLFSVAVVKKGNADEALEVTRLEPRLLGETFTVSGTLAADSMQSVYLQPDRGELKRIWVKTGQQVNRGDKLVEYDNPASAAELAQAELQIRSARVKLKYLQKQKNSLSGSWAGPTGGPASGTPAAPMSKEELDQQIELTRLELKQAEKQRELAKARISRQSVTSRIQGTVVLVNEQGGTGADAAEPLVVVADLKRIRVVADISEYDVLKLKPGLAVTLRSEALPDKSWTGKVEHIADLPKKTSAAEAAGGDAQVLYPVDIRPDEALPFRVGSRLIVEIHVSGEKVPGLPESAVKEDGDKHFVFVVDGGKAVRKEVKVGRRNGEFVQVLSGLSSEETVISDPPEGLVSGAEVRIR